MKTETETEPASLAAIKTATKTFSKQHEALADRLKIINDRIEDVKRRHMISLRAEVNRVAAAHQELHTLIKSAPGLFEKPRTYIFHGVKVGMGKKKGTIEIADPDKTVELIKKHFKELSGGPHQHRTETPVKKALSALSAGDQLKKIGCEVTKDTDAVVIKPHGRRYRKSHCKPSSKTPPKTSRTTGRRMSMKTLEQAILAGARTILNNPKLKMADITDWNTDDKQVKDDLTEGEIFVRLPDPGVGIAVDSSRDKRPNPNAITCQRCKAVINPEDVVPVFGQHFEGDTEFRFACKCGQGFYTFVKLDWFRFEN
jgi:hypothetical protein